jgi:hypothetical protein
VRQSRNSKLRHRVQMSRLKELIRERRRRQPGKDDVIFIQWPALDKDALWVASIGGTGVEQRRGESFAVFRDRAASVAREKKFPVVCLRNW